MNTLVSLDYLFGRAGPSALWRFFGQAGRRVAVATLVALFAVGWAPPVSAQIPPDLLKRAQAGSASAQFQLSNIYHEGSGVPQDYEKAFEWVEKAALQGDAEAQNNLGYMYDRGEGVPQNNKKAAEWYLKAAQQGQPNAQTSLGGLYERGEGVPRDYRKAFEWYSKAAAQGFRRAQAYLGAMYEDGTGVPRDYKKAFELYTQAAEATPDENDSNNYAQYRLATMYDEGKGITKDDKKAFEWYLKSAEQGYSYAQCSLGVMYSQGRGTPKDPKKALEWYKKSADQGNVQAQNNIGALYDEDGGLPRDDKKAFLWYAKAAHQNLGDAQYNLGLMYFNAQGVRGNTVTGCAWIQISGETPLPISVRMLCGIFATAVQKKKNEILKEIELYQKAEAGDAEAQYKFGSMLARADEDHEEAIRWYVKAANQGHVSAQNKLGTYYMTGMGAPRDDKKAVELFAKAANQGLGDAQYNLGLMYNQGLGVPKDYRKALGWYTKAAYQGVLSAQFNLGALYVNGEGVPSDSITGCAWIYLSKGAKGIDQCDASLTPPEKANALKLKEEFARKIDAHAAPPPIPGELSEQTLRENERRIDAMKEEQEQLLAKARRELAAMPKYTPAELARNPQAREQEERRQKLTRALAVIEQRMQEQNAKPRKRFLSPNTLGPIYFPYYLAMCRKIEARGTAHFPQADGRKLYGQLFMALLVHHDGRLLQTHVVSSSGNPTLDRLAEEIARAAAPFGEFTPAMRKDADQIDITMGFKFTNEPAQNPSTSCDGSVAH